MITGRSPFVVFCLAALAAGCGRGPSPPSAPGTRSAPAARAVPDAPAAAARAPAHDEQHPVIKEVAEPPVVETEKETPRPSPQQHVFEFSDEQRKSRYIETFKRWAEEDKGRLPVRDGVLCVGSSSMRGWGDIRKDLEPLEVIHRGFGGSTMRDVLLFKDFFLRYEAGTVLVYEGDNDLMSDATTPEVFAGQCREFCDAVFGRRPDARVFFISVKPSPSRWNRWPRFSEANRLLAAMCDEDARLGLIDVATPMLGEDGKPRADIFLGDRLHMNRKGYDVWRDAVRSALIR